MAQYTQQEKDLIYALDIGTRSVIGIVGRMEEERFKVLAVDQEEHGKRAMMDGQIDDIERVAGVARIVTGRLESKLGIRLSRVCVAAAGRALRTERASFSLELPKLQAISEEDISQLETGAVSAAEAMLQGVEQETQRQFFLVGYTVAQYRLDHYPMNTLRHHNGQFLEADVVATFLPGEVVESLYAAMRTAQLQVVSMTLEPIAAMNAAIPAELRLLNLALVDIGAGTSDIALCRDGSVVGYTMVTVAGDEVTEAVMRALLVDFKTAEAIKQQILPDGADIQFTDILGIKQSITCEELINIIQESMRQLSNEIAKQILAINDGPPSALFLAGGGSKLYGLRKRMAECLEMDERRVAIAGNNFEKSAFSEELDLENPEYATPLGIAVSAGMGLINDSYVVLLNGQPAKLFRNGLLTLRDILLMNGYTYGDILGKTGRGLTVTLNGKRLVFRGEPATPSVLKVNGEEAPITTVVHAGDQITFTPAKPGMDVQKTPKELLREDFNGRVFINGEEAALDTPLNQGDTILTLNGRDAVPPKAPPPPPQPVPVIPAAPVRHTARQAAVSTAQTQPAAPSAQSVVPPVNQVQSAPPADPVQSVVQPTAPPAAPVQSALLRGIQVVLNGTSLVLPPKQDGMPYYLMDLLQFSGLDFDHLERPVVLKVNGQEGRFQDILRNRDTVDIHMI